MAGNWRRFAVLFGSALLLFASVLGVVVTVEHDQHCQLAEVRESPQGESVEYYHSELTPEQQQLFERLREEPDTRFEDAECFGGTVRYEDQYYVVEDGRSIVWANPPMLAALGGMVGALGVVYVLARREARSLPW